MLLELKNIRKKYKISKNEYQEVLKGINVNFKSGEFVCIYGESGSGKSTLMNIIGGLDNNYSGKIFINKKDLKTIKLDDYRRDKIGFIFQNFNLISNLTVLENIMIVLDMLKLPASEKIKKSKISLRKVGLLNYMNKKPNELSGGQKQRVAIARAIVNEPDIILADEPTGALDAKNAENILKILKQISKDGRLVIVVTHSNKVEKYSDRIITIEDGKIQKNEIINNRSVKKKEKKFIKRNLNSLTCIKIGLNNILKNIKRNILLIIASSIGIIGILLSLFIGSGVKKYINNEIKNNINPLLFNVNNINTNKLYDIKYYTNEDIKKINEVKNIKKIIKEASIQTAYIIYNDKKYDLISLSSYSNMKDKNIKVGNIIDKDKIVFSEYLTNNILGNRNYKNLIDKDIKLYLLDTSEKEPILMNKKLKISGIYKNGNIDLINNSNFAYLTYDTLYNIYRESNRILKPTEIKIEINNKDNIDSVKKEMKKLGYNITNVSEYTNSIFKYLDIATIILSSFSFISLIVSCIMIIIVFNINVIERTKEIGILRALGFRKKDIKKVFQTEAILIGLLTGLFSSIISSSLSKMINGIIENKFKINIIDINMKFLLFGILIGILVCFIGCIIPSKKASKLNIIDSLRYE